MLNLRTACWNIDYDEKYPVLNRDNLTIPIQIQLSQKKIIFFSIFAAFLKSRLNVKVFESKDDPQRFCIFKVTDSKNVVREISKKSHFTGCFKKRYGKNAEVPLNSPSQHLYHIHWSLTMKLCWKKSLLFSCQILGLLVKTLSTIWKYPVLNRKILTIPIQMQLSHKEKNFS